MFYWRRKVTAELEFIVEADNKLYPFDVKKAEGKYENIREKLTE